MRCDAVEKELLRRHQLYWIRELERLMKIKPYIHSAISPGRMIRLVFLWFFFFPAGALALCPGVRFVARPPPDFFGDDLGVNGFERAVHASLAALSRAGGRGLALGDQFVAPERVRAGLELLLRLRDESPGRAAFLAAIKKKFLFYQPVFSRPATKLLVTGYYQPVYPASREKTGSYRYPVYGLPKDLAVLANGRIGRWRAGGLVPYPTRAEIESHGLAAAPVLAWMRDPVEVFIVHVQGSAVLRLPDGGDINLGFAGRNGRPYRSIGAYLVQKGLMRLSEVTMPAIVSFLKHHPDMVTEVLNHNQSYIFFQVTGKGPRGSLGEPLVAGRSVALDSRCFPDGAPLFLSTRKPYIDSSGQVTGSAPMRRLVLHQDSGSAIRGPARLDLFIGRGDAAAAVAGVMRQPGEIFVLLPRRDQEIVADAMPD